MTTNSTLSAEFAKHILVFHAFFVLVVKLVAVRAVLESAVVVLTVVVAVTLVVIPVRFLSVAGVATGISPSSTHR